MNTPPDLTLESYFAAQALAGLCANPAQIESSTEELVSLAWDMADEMLRIHNMTED